MKNAASKTALTSAAQRALHTLYGDEPKVFVDEYALGLSGSFWSFVIRNKPIAWLFQKIYAWAKPMMAHHLARSRYVEEHLETLLLNDVDQYVLLGAGMDSFAFRRPELSDCLSVFEVDHPLSQQMKRERVKVLGLQEPDNIEYLAVDFERGELRKKLQASRYSEASISIVSWMGVTPYLTKDAIIATLRDIADCSAPGTEIIFDAMNKRAFTEGKQKLTGKKLFKSSERRGEPLISGFDVLELEEILNLSGYSIVEILTSDDFTSRWFRSRRDGLQPWAYIFVVRARVN